MESEQASFAARAERSVREAVMRAWKSRSLLLALIGALALSAAAHAQAWPTRPITLVVPFPAGGNADVLARALAPELSEKLGQQVIVDNRTGASGNIGGAAVAKAAPDGYTFMFGTTGPIATTKLLSKTPPYDPEKDLAPVILVAKAPLIVAAYPGFPAKDLKELIAYAKQNPGTVNAGTPGNGSLGQLASELLQQHAGIKMTHVPYRGSAPVMTDLIGGQLNVSFDFMPTYIPLVNDGKVRPLAVTSRTRVPSLPNVMTVQEAGFAGFEATGWFAIVAPAGTPADAIAKVNTITNTWLNSPKGKAVLDTFVMQAAGGTPDDLRAYIKEELAKWEPIIKAANIAM
jgi:tripartite-type tricarboxylate transporter receptor subunit TctC